jgi:uncharacterized protein involved in type VI secretion and phage assembly
MVVDHPLFSVDEANAMAKGLANDISIEYIQAEGEAYGHPQLTAGKTVKLTNMGKRFSGKYFVTAATHVFNEQGYVTTFAISGRQPTSVADILNEQTCDTAGQGLIRGVVPAVVTNLNDPQSLGRVKVKFPWLGDNVESTWVRVVAPMGGGGRGFMYIPEIDDEVLIAFEHGDPHRPYLIGGLWNNKDKPPKSNSAIAPNGKVDERLIQSRSGAAGGHTARTGSRCGGIEACSGTGRGVFSFRRTSDNGWSVSPFGRRDAALKVARRKD